MALVPTRLEQTHPELAAWWAVLPPDERVGAAHRLAVEAANRTGLTLPPSGTDLAAWAQQLDDRGWSQDADGTWEQAPDDFARARAAAAVRDAGLAVERPEAAADAVYEAVTVLGDRAVHAFLRARPSGPAR